MKNFFKYRYLYFPVVLLLIYFGVDKIFSLEYYKMLTMDDAPYLTFEYKEDLIKSMPPIAKKLEQENSQSLTGLARRSKKKSLLVLGTSRLLFISHQFFKRNYPDWEFFNFSGPVTYPAYYLYVLERSLETGLRPDLIIVETAAFQYSDGTDAFLRSNMAYSFDLKFIWDYFSLFQKDEVSYFLARYLFSGYRYPPKFKNISKRLKKPKEDQVLLTFQAIDSFQKGNRGSSRNIIPKDNWFQTDLAMMDYQATHKTIPWLYSNYKISNRQFSFMEKLLKTAQDYNIQVILVSPAVSSSLFRATRSNASLNESLKKYKSRMSQMLKKHPVRLIDFNQHENYKCNTFVDDAHMSMDCYNLMIDELMNNQN